MEIFFYTKREIEFSQNNKVTVFSEPGTLKKYSSTPQGIIVDVETLPLGEELAKQLKTYISPIVFYVDTVDNNSDVKNYIDFLAPSSKGLERYLYNAEINEMYDLSYFSGPTANTSNTSDNSSSTEAGKATQIQSSKKDLTPIIELIEKLSSTTKWCLFYSNNSNDDCNHQDIIDEISNNESVLTFSQEDTIIRRLKFGKYKGLILNTIGKMGEDLHQVVDLAFRARSECRFAYPIVFLTAKEHNSLSFFKGIPFMWTFGLKQFIFSAKAGIIKPTEEPNATRSTNNDPNTIIPDLWDFIKEQSQFPLTNIQFEHLKMYYDPISIIARLRHDAEYPDKLADCKEQLKNLCIKKDVSDDGIDNNTGKDAFIIKCNEIEKRLADEKDSNPVSITADTIHALLIDDEDMKDMIEYYNKRNIEIDQVETVTAAIDKLTAREKNYTVVICDLLLQGKFKFSESEEVDMVNAKQGYDLLKKLEYLNYTYSVILFSNLPRNFKVAISNYTNLKLRNFTMKSCLLGAKNATTGTSTSGEDAAQGAQPDKSVQAAYNQLEEMIQEAHYSYGYDIVLRAFGGKTGMALKYMQYRQGQGSFGDDFEKKCTALIRCFKTFIEKIIPAQSNERSQSNAVEFIPFSHVDLKGLTSTINEVFNEKDLDKAVEDFINNLYDWSFESFCEIIQNMPREQLQAKGNLLFESDSTEIKNITQSVKVKCEDLYYANIKKSNLDDIINNNPIIDEFITECYRETIPTTAFLQQFKLRDDLRGFVKRLLLYKNNEADQMKMFEMRLIVRRFALFLFFWMQIEQENAKALKRLYINKFNYKKQDKALTEEDMFDQALVCEILRRSNSIKKSSKTAPDQGTTSKYLWLKNIVHTAEPQATCDFMTMEEISYFEKNFEEFFGGGEKTTIYNFKSVK